MCHTEVPGGAAVAPAPRADVLIPVGSGEQMPATLFDGGHGAPGVLLIADINGPSPFYACLADRLAHAGFTVLLPDYFFRQGPTEGPELESAFARRLSLDELRTVADLEAATDWLNAKLGTARAGSLGFCMGGTFSLDLASLREDMVTVSYYGFPVPQATLVMPPPRPIDLVDRLSGPVLAFWGEEDMSVGPDNVRAYAEQAAKHNPRFAHEVVAGVGHGFLAKADLDDPEDAGGATWQRTVEHLRTHLPTTH